MTPSPPPYTDAKRRDATRPPRAGATLLLVALALAGCETDAGAGGTGTFATQDTQGGGADVDAGASGDGAAHDGGTHDGAAHDGATHDGAAQDGAGHDGAALDGGDAGLTGALVPAGRYASVQRLSTVLKLPPAGTESVSVNTALSLHDVTHVGGQVRVTSRTCAISQPKLSGVEVVFTDKFVASIPEWTSTISVAANGGGSYSFALAEGTVLFGVKLANPLTDPLPTKGDDPSVTDPDDDGKPGGTVKLVGLIQGEMYVVQRRSSGLQGTVNATTGAADGLLLGSVEQAMVGASSDLLLAFDLNAKKDPDASASTFSWRPVAADLTCAALQAQASTLFGD